MKITLLTIGRLGPAPEAALARDYAVRATNGGRALGLGPVEIIELESRKPGKALGPAWLAVCDEHGKAHTSRDFAAHIGRLRDDGHRRMIIVIGGADGLDSGLMSTARERLAFGIQTWPHALARVMLAEQVYRATTLLAGGPYHRD
jgi:23S rRNA (pseudouridine1915-N3)-methyltransferase